MEKAITIGNNMQDGAYLAELMLGKRYEVHVTRRLDY